MSNKKNKNKQTRISSIASTDYGIAILVGRSEADVGESFLIYVRYICLIGIKIPPIK